MANQILYSLKFIYGKNSATKQICVTKSVISKFLEYGIKVDIFYENFDNDIKDTKIDELLKKDSYKERLKIYELDTTKSTTYQPIIDKSKCCNNSSSANNLNIDLNKRFKINCKVEGIVCIDGDNKRDIKTLSECVKNYEFNYEQYEYEHASTDNKCVRTSAGAGSGKTTTTTQRISYLVDVKGYRFEDIHLLTFTRDATREMVNKQRKDLQKKEKITCNNKSIIDLNNQLDMKVSTIDSYFSNLTKVIGVRLGYNNDTKIRTLLYEKKEIIKSVLNTRPDLLKKVIDKIHIYELVDIIYEYWENLNSLCLSDEEIRDLDWGPINKSNQNIGEILKYTFDNIPSRLRDFKRKENIAEIHDFTIQLKLLAEKNDDKINEDIKKIIENKFGKPKVIIIDEFQDCNLSQIKIFAWLCKILDARIEIIGDVKQSIYRFRGSYDTSMDQLKKELEKQFNNTITIEDLTLFKNYRTEGFLLEKIQKIFEGWEIKYEGKPKENFLDINLIGMKRNDNIKNIVEAKYVEKFINYSDNDDEVKNEIKGILHKHKDWCDRNIYLVNNKLEQIKQLLIKKGISEELELQAKKYLKAVIENKYDELDKDIIYEVENIIPLNLLTTTYKQRILNILDKDYKDYTVTVLVRKNSEADKIKSICEEENISYQINSKGNFYRHKAVTDFNALLGVCNEIENTSKLARFRETPYSNKLKDKEEIRNLTRQLRHKKFFNLVFDLIETSELKKNYFSEIYLRLKEKDEKSYTSEELVNKANYYAEEYMLNLYKLLEILQQAFGQNPTINEVYTYLSLQIKTNKNEEQLRYEKDDNSVVQCYTVHTAKGMEYKNVFIPYTNNYFCKNGKDTEIIVDVDKNKIGFNITKNKQLNFKNEYYDDLIEKENLKLVLDEMRLLYVALTRAEESLYLILPTNYYLTNGKLPNNWGELIKNENILVKI